MFKVKVKDISLKQFLFTLIFLGQVIPLSIFMYLSYSRLNSSVKEKFLSIKQQTENTLETSLNVFQRISKSHQPVIGAPLKKKIAPYFKSYQSLKDFLENQLPRLKKELQSEFFIGVFSKKSETIRRFPKSKYLYLNRIIRNVVKHVNLIPSFEEKEISFPMFIPLKNIDDHNIAMISLFTLPNEENFLVLVRKETLENNMFEKIDDIIQEVTEANPHIISIKFQHNTITSEGALAHPTSHIANNFWTPRKNGDSETIRRFNEGKGIIHEKRFKTGIRDHQFDQTILLSVIYDFEKEEAEALQMKIIYLILYLILLALCLYFSHLISRFIMNPFESIVGDIEKVSSQDLSHPISPVFIRELSLLRSSVQDLVKSILKKLNRISSLSQQIINAQEQERKNIAKELHDGVGQNLVSLKINLELILQELPESHHEPLKKALNLSSSCVDEVRSLYSGLYPSILTEIGFKSAIEWLLDSFVHKGVSYKLKTERLDEINPAIAIHLYRITQEVISNMQKHSKGNFFSLSICKNDTEVTYDYYDNGIGLSDKKDFDGLSGFGMDNIRLRVSDLKGSILFEPYQSEPPQGLKILIKIPNHKNKRVR